MTLSTDTIGAASGFLTYGIPGLAALLFLGMCLMLSRQLGDLPPMFRVVALTIWCATAIFFLGATIYVTQQQASVAVRMDLGERRPDLLDLVVFKNNAGRSPYQANMDLQFIDRERLTISLDGIMDFLGNVEANLNATGARLATVRAELDAKSRLVEGQAAERANAVRAQVAGLMQSFDGQAGP